MVIDDLSATKVQEQIHHASALDRFLAGVFDVLLLMPIATFVPSLHIRDARLDYLQGFESNVWIQIGVLWFLTAIVLQTVFLYFLKTTPGGLIMHLRVRSLNGRLTWNQCLMRSTFYLLSWVMLAGLPLLEILTHPFRRAWHDRVSDTLVLDVKSKPSEYRGYRMNTQAVRFFMIFGIFCLMFLVYSLVLNKDEVTYLATATNLEDTDSFVAQALLRRDESEEIQNEVEEKIWTSRKPREKSLAYFFKMQVEKNDDVRKALAEQICKWQKGSLCTLAQYNLEKDVKSLQALAAKVTEEQYLTSRVFLMKELTEQAQYASALKIYKQLKKQSSLEDSLKMWDVRLFWALREKQMAGKRAPASEDESQALKDFVKERGLP